MKVPISRTYKLFGLLLVALTAGCSSPSSSKLILDEWERGFVIAPGENPEMQIFIWFYEWHLFDAVNPGIHTPAYGRSADWTVWNKWINEARTEGYVEKEDMRLELKSLDDGIEIKLIIENLSDHDWPGLAAIIPCFNPGPPPGSTSEGKFHRNKEFVDLDSTHSYFVGPDSTVTLLKNRSIHFNHFLKPQVEKVRSDSGSFVFDSKWPPSPVDSYAGLIIRESQDRKWVTGIAWEKHLSAQGHNPWLCMHLSVLVGPLKQGEKKEIRGKIYLFQGSKEECYQRFLADFTSSE